MSDLQSAVREALSQFTDGELREEVRKRGYELHSQNYSASMQNEVRACAKLIAEATALKERIEALLREVK